MTFFARNQIVLAKIESSYGTDPTPAEDTNAILTKNLTRTIYDGNRVQRDLNLPYMGNDHSINTAPFVTVSFDVEFAGSGAAGTAPQFGCLLRACGLDETVVADTSVTYAPISSAFESVTLYYNYDGEMQKVIGARGTATLNMAKGQIPTISFSFTGLYAKPTAVTQYDPTYTDTVPFPFSSYNTTTFSLHSQAVFGESFSLNLGCNVVHRNLAGFDGVLITDRAPTATALFEAVAIATKDYFVAAHSHLGAVVEGALSIVHGSGAGKVCTIASSQVQIANISEQDSDGVRMFNADLILVPTDGGNDEFSIAFT